ncbi:DUF3794 domain-containing protein [Clostridium sp. DL1XJH146]
MASIVKHLIEYVGIVEYSQLPLDMTAFKQLTVEENLVIPSAKPDIEQIVRVMAEAIITSTKIIKTPRGTALEGQILTGRKIIIEGILNQKIEYVADEATQPVHAAHFKVPFSTFIVLPEDFEDGTVVTIIPYIEDIFVKQTDKRNIFKNVTLLLHAVY